MKRLLQVIVSPNKKQASMDTDNIVIVREMHFLKERKYVHWKFQMSACIDLTVCYYILMRIYLFQDCYFPLDDLLRFLIWAEK